MPDYQLDTPVAFLVFNRPENTARVFEQIRLARPPRLLLAADGPRDEVTGEAERCAAARVVVEAVDWPCEVSRDFSTVNLGCMRREASWFDWVFDEVEEAILLEDDCLPHPSFFRFCEELLERYRHDDRVMHISGDNFESAGRENGALHGLSRNLRFGERRQASYYFSRYPNSWGWASWRRAWQSYDVEMTAWKTAPNKDSYLDQFCDPSERSFWKDTWDSVSRGEIDTWDYQWVFACMARRALSIVPKRNLISNIGFGERATHTTGESALADLPVQELGFPLRHPRSFARNAAADAHIARLAFGRSPKERLVRGRSAREVLGRLLGRHRTP